MTSPIRPLLRPFKRVAEWVGGTVAQGLFSLMGTRSGLVLAYHSISTSAWIHAVHPTAFASQLDWLQAHAEVVPLAELEARFLTGTVTRSLRPVVAITFDDGYQDWLDHALPLLTARKLPATFFVSTAFAEAATRTEHDGVRLLPSEAIRHLVTSYSEVGAHGHKHVDLSQATVMEANEELTQSKRLLEAWTGISVTRMSYPKNRYRPETVGLVERAGYVAAYAGNDLVSATSDRFRLGRMTITNDITLTRFIHKVFLAFFRIF